MSDKKLTIERLKESFSHDVNAGIDFAKEFYPAYPEKPSKPILKRDGTSKEATQYAKDLADWENADIEYKKQKDAYNKGKNQVDEVIESFIKDLAGLNNIPEKYREKVWSKAWQEGHSSGYSEVYNCLVDLLDIFQ